MRDRALSAMVAVAAALGWRGESTRSYRLRRWVRAFGRSQSDRLKDWLSRILSEEENQAGLFMMLRDAGLSKADRQDLEAALGATGNRFNLIDVWMNPRLPSFARRSASRAVPSSSRTPSACNTLLTPVAALVRGPAAAAPPLAAL